MSYTHRSVLLQEILQVFENRSLRLFVDGTLGAGGHSSYILRNHPELESLIGIDQDPTAREIARKELDKWKEKVTIVAGNFRDLKKIIQEQGENSADGILLDLGVSSMQFNMPEKGFSFMKEGPLDMRMDPSGDLTADEVVNTWPEQKLGRIFREYGEEKRWKRASRAIVEARVRAPIRTTQELSAILRPVLPPLKKGLNPLTLVFQALRICVNGELDALTAVLPDAISLLAKGGRLAVISFHSLEDRIVKGHFRYESSDKEDTSGIGGVFIDKQPRVKLVTRKPITPSAQEEEENPRSRSAKLRIAERL